jgi:hypothetical protein
MVSGFRRWVRHCRHSRAGGPKSWSGSGQARGECPCGMTDRPYGPKDWDGLNGHPAGLIDWTNGGL